MSNVLDLAGAPSAFFRVPGLGELSGLSRTLVMGVVNVTPDSFSDGGLHADTASAVGHALRLVEDGADLIDVGGESTRPGGERVSEDEELARTIPTVERLSGEGVAVSIDTMRASVAKAATEAGALIVNDVSAGLADDAMIPTVEQCRTRLGQQPVYVAMHWRGHSATAMEKAAYSHVAADVSVELKSRLEAAERAGIERARIVADPGFGFSKTGDDNWSLMRDLEQVERLGYPLLVGVSRKRFLAALGVDRDAATAAISALCQLRRVWAVRVHDVASTVATMRVMERLMDSEPAPGTLGAIADMNYGGTR